MKNSIIYLVVGCCYFKDDPNKENTKEWHLDAYTEESKAKKKVEELRIKEYTRIKNLLPGDWDINIRNNYSVEKLWLWYQE